MSLLYSHRKSASRRIYKDPAGIHLCETPQGTRNGVNQGEGGIGDSNYEGDKLNYGGGKIESFTYIIIIIIIYSIALELLEMSDWIVELNSKTLDEKSKENCLNCKLSISCTSR